MTGTLFGGALLVGIMFGMVAVETADATLGAVAVVLVAAGLAGAR